MRLNLRPNLSNYLISFLIRKYCDKAQERYVISSTMDNLIYKERNETYTRAVVSVLYKPSVGYVPGASPQPQRKSPHFCISASGGREESLEGVRQGSESTEAGLPLQHLHKCEVVGNTPSSSP